MPDKQDAMSSPAMLTSAPRQASPGPFRFQKERRAAQGAVVTEVVDVVEDAPAMQGWLAIRGTADLQLWQRHWFVLRCGVMEYYEFGDKAPNHAQAMKLQPTSRAIGFGAAAAALAERRGSPGDAASLASTRPWGFVLDLGGHPAGMSGTVSERRYMYFDPGSKEALEAWVGAVGREAARLSGAGAWAEVEACKAAIAARSKAEEYVKNGGVFAPSPRRSQERRIRNRSPRGTCSSWSDGLCGQSFVSSGIEGTASPSSPSRGPLHNLRSPSSPGAWAEMTASSPGRPWAHQGVTPSSETISLAKLLAAKAEFQAENEELRAVSRATEAAQRQVAEVAMSEMVAQSRQAGTTAAEQKRLCSELESVKAMHAEALNELNEARQRLVKQTTDDRKGKTELEAALHQQRQAEAKMPHLESCIEAEQAQCRDLKAKLAQLQSRFETEQVHAREMKEEAERLQREKSAREEAERVRLERKAKEEKERVQREQQAKEEKERVQREQKSKEEKERVQREQKAKEEEERVQRERKAKEEEERVQQERKAKEEKERVQREQKAKEEAERVQREQKDQEEKLRVQQEQKAKEAKERVEREQKAEEEKERVQREQEEKERAKPEQKAKEEKDRVQVEQKPKEEKECVRQEQPPEGLVEEQKERRSTLIESVPLLKNLLPEERADIADRLKQHTHREGDKIIAQGDKGNDMFIVEEGLVHATMSGQRVKEYTAAQYFGELALLKSHPQAADMLVGTTPTSVLSLEGDEFRRLFGSLADLHMRAEEMEYASADQQQNGAHALRSPRHATVEPVQSGSDRQQPSNTPLQQPALAKSPPALASLDSSQRPAPAQQQHVHTPSRKGVQSSKAELDVASSVSPTGIDITNRHATVEPVQSGSDRQQPSNTPLQQPALAKSPPALASLDSSQHPAPAQQQHVHTPSRKEVQFSKAERDAASSVSPTGADITNRHATVEPAHSGSGRQQPSNTPLQQPALAKSPPALASLDSSQHPAPAQQQHAHTPSRKEVQFSNAEIDGASSAVPTGADIMNRHEKLKPAQPAPLSSESFVQQVPVQQVPMQCPHLDTASGRQAPESKAELATPRHEKLEPVQLGPDRKQASSTPLPQPKSAESQLAPASSDSSVQPAPVQRHHPDTKSARQTPVSKAEIDAPRHAQGLQEMVPAGSAASGLVSTAENKSAMSTTSKADPVAGTPESPSATLQRQRRSLFGSFGAAAAGEAQVPQSQPSTPRRRSGIFDGRLFRAGFTDGTTSEPQEFFEVSEGDQIQVNGDTNVRETDHMESTVLRVLPAGARCTVVQVSKSSTRQRAKVEVPPSSDEDKGCIGWINCTTSKGGMLVRREEQNFKKQSAATSSPPSSAVKVETAPRNPSPKAAATSNPASPSPSPTRKKSFSFPLPTFSSSKKA